MSACRFGAYTQETRKIFISYNQEVEYMRYTHSVLNWGMYKWIFPNFVRLLKYSVVIDFFHLSSVFILGFDTCELSTRNGCLQDPVNF